MSRATILIDSLENLLRNYNKDEIYAGLELLTNVKSDSYEVLYGLDNFKIAISLSNLDTLRQKYVYDGKIQAIKCLRQLANCGLKEAKDVVELAAQRFQWTFKNW